LDQLTEYDRINAVFIDDSPDATWSTMTSADATNKSTLLSAIAARPNSATTYDFYTALDVA